MLQVSNLTTHLLKPDHGLEVLLKGRANLVCEGADLLLNLEKDDKKAFADMIALFGKGKKCKTFPSYVYVIHMIEKYHKKAFADMIALFGKGKKCKHLSFLCTCIQDEYDRKVSQEGFCGQDLT